MLDDLTEACREPIAEMERNGLTADKGWGVSHVRVNGGYVEFKNGDTFISFDRDTMYPAYRWHVMDGSSRVGGSNAVLSSALGKAKANGWPL